MRAFCNPTHIAFGPGGGSPVRSRYPPSRAISRTMTPSEGTTLGTRVPVTTAYTAFHSDSLSTTSHGTSGVARPSIVSRNTRHATTR